MYLPVFLVRKNRPLFLGRSFGGNKLTSCGTKTGTGPPRSKPELLQNHAERSVTLAEAAIQAVQSLFRRDYCVKIRLLFDSFRSLHSMGLAHLTLCRNVTPGKKTKGNKGKRSKGGKDKDFDAVSLIILFI